VSDASVLENVSTFTGKTPLMMAAEFGHLAVLKAFWESRPHLFMQLCNAKDIFGATAFSLASRNGHDDICTFLSTFGHKDNTISCLDHDMQQLVWHNCFRTLARLATPDPDSLLIIAIEAGSLECVTVLLTRSISPQCFIAAAHRALFADQAIFAAFLKYCSSIKDMTSLVNTAVRESRETCVSLVLHKLFLENTLIPLSWNIFGVDSQAIAVSFFQSSIPQAETFLGVALAVQTAAWICMLDRFGHIYELRQHMLVQVVESLTPRSHYNLARLAKIVQLHSISLPHSYTWDTLLALLK
jgi:hypothetical protein